MGNKNSLEEIECNKRRYTKSEEMIVTNCVAYGEISTRNQQLKNDTFAAYESITN